MKWKKMNTDNQPPILVSLLCIRAVGRICNLYFDGRYFYDDGYDSTKSRKFNDITHWVRLEDIELPKELTQKK